MTEEKNLKDVTPDTPESPIEVSSSAKPYYPSFCLKLDDIPEAKQWEIGKNYMLIIAVKMKSLHLDENGSDVRFDVIKVKHIKK